MSEEKISEALNILQTQKKVYFLGHQNSIVYQQMKILGTDFRQSINQFLVNHFLLHQPRFQCV